MTSGGLLHPRLSAVDAAECPQCGAVFLLSQLLNVVVANVPDDDQVAEVHYSQDGLVGQCPDCGVELTIDHVVHPTAAEIAQAID